jgi:hypothetical protein
MNLSNMPAFVTRNKIPLAPWRRGARVLVGQILGRNQQAGIVPGEVGCVVLDMDKKYGLDGRKELFDKFPNLPRSMNYETQSGGYHLWYKVPEGTVIPQATSKIPGVDIRYIDGYVCVNPEYEILLDGVILDCPEDVLAWLTEEKKTSVKQYRVREGESAKYTTLYDLSPIPKGRRNDSLFRWGRGLLNGVDKGELTLSDLEDLVRLRGRISGMAINECDLILESLLTNVR